MGTVALRVVGCSVAPETGRRGAGQIRGPVPNQAWRGTRTTLESPVPDDRALAAQAAQGSEKAFRELLRRYERPVFSLIYRMVRDRGIAEDLSQETFIRTFNAIASYNPGYKFSSWIFKIAHNLTIDHLRKKRIDTISIHGSPDAVTPDEQARTRLVLESTYERPDAYVENIELGGQIEAAIARLRPEYRAVTLLRHVEGYSYQEIADILELPLGTVKTYIHRARLELKAALAPIT
ncbi:MAG: sigma-70 family RNA polymerase sigma factor [Gemmatimonadetes bacterium]|nr:sigma-70 family RNA polymerase sigma factor [Gemmatimonadota bacterium]MYE18200.1 sigma-70 family RNA polymerase sigma factor [Gemmatimonadota bacterium]